MDKNEKTKNDGTPVEKEMQSLMQAMTKKLRQRVKPFLP